MKIREKCGEFKPLHLPILRHFFIIPRCRKRFSGGALEDDDNLLNHFEYN